MKKLLIPAIIALSVSAAFAENQVATLRGTAPLDENPDAPVIPKVVNSDIRQVRNYPEQPPVIPHKIDGYQIDIKYNQCLTCHARSAIEVSQAPMVSITHFMDRDGQFLASVSPRRFFCTQCHVPQSEARIELKNTFVDVDEVLDYIQSQGGGSE
ncbi:nitrate reductase cytochrome c-type subunit [uncultured Roseovarius sp.]|uniref:nitrate reductase cytochrome c-type subunit n=1 Tax=uncultured Roseovarius sp. TaxID=293344 RepID=UPI00261252EF|nr:nitrate reductase cytochrome c-type subunit [uncultured Roseovarius sp.]